MGHKSTPKRLVFRLAAIILGATTLAFSAQAEMRSFGLRGFSEVRVGSGLEMLVEVGPEFSIEATGERDAIDTVDIYLDGATLVVERKHNWRETLFSWSSEQRRVQLAVTMPMISALAADAGARIEISGNINQPLRAIAAAGAALKLNGLDGADVAITASAGASVLADGTCATLQAVADSGAHIQAPMLACRAVTADAMSGASVVVNGRETLSLGAAGGGSVFAHGAGVLIREARQSGGSITVKR